MLNAAKFIKFGLFIAWIEIQQVLLCLAKPVRQNNITLNSYKKVEFIVSIAVS